jgi:hypothetical protein
MLWTDIGRKQAAKSPFIYTKTRFTLFGIANTSAHVVYRHLESCTLLLHGVPFCRETVPTVPIRKEVDTVQYNAVNCFTELRDGWLLAKFSD